MCKEEILIDDPEAEVQVLEDIVRFLTEHPYEGHKRYIADMEIVALERQIDFIEWEAKVQEELDEH